MSRAEKAQKILAILDELYPDPEIPLDHEDPFTLLIAVLLSAQTTDVGVNKVTPALFREAPTPAKMAKLSSARILHHIKTIGMAPTKAKRVKALAQQLMDAYGGLRSNGSRQPWLTTTGVWTSMRVWTRRLVCGSPRWEPCRWRSSPKGSRISR